MRVRNLQSAWERFIAQPEREMKGGVNGRRRNRRNRSRLDRRAILLGR